MIPEPLLYAALSEDIVGSAMKVLNTLRPGWDEKTYENALVIELRRRGHQIEQQKHYDVIYDRQLVDTLIPDLVVDELVIVDPKVSDAFTTTHVAQMIGYLNITHLRLAILLNFKHVDLRWKRVVL